MLYKSVEMGDRMTIPEILKRQQKLRREMFNLENERSTATPWRQAEIDSRKKGINSEYIQLEQERIRQVKAGNSPTL